MTEQEAKRSALNSLVIIVLAFGPLLIAIGLVIFGFVDRAAAMLMIQLVIWACLNLSNDGEGE